MTSSEIFALRKKNRSAEALEMARAGYPDNIEDIWFLRAYAWALYDHIKKIIELYEAKKLSPNALSDQLTPYMREFSKFANPLRGDSAFSHIVRLAGKTSKDWRAFLAFARWADPETFSADDRKPFETDDGKKIDSLHKRFVRAVCRETAVRCTDPGFNPELLEWGRDVLEKALQADPNDQWLNYYRSKLHLAQGETAEAIKRLTVVLQRQPRAAWTWAQLGEILEHDQPSDALTCYAYATQLAREEQEVAKVRIHLAHHLALALRFQEAAHQAMLAQRYREEHGFRNPAELEQILASDWYQEALANDALQPIANMQAPARALLQQIGRSTLTYTPGVVEHINHEKALSYIATGVATGVGLPHRKFPEIANLEPGTLVEIGRNDPAGPALDWRLSSATEIPGLCKSFTGTLERHEGKAFAFVDCALGDVFVPPALAQQFAADQEYSVQGMAIRRTNKQGKTGWRAAQCSGQELTALPNEDDLYGL